MVAKVDDKAAWYVRQADRWDVARTLLGGTEEMRKHPEYLPKFNMEPQEAYNLRLQNSVLTNIYLQMAQRMIGVVFREPVKVNDSKIPPDILDNIDNRGRDIHAFAEFVGFQALTRGIHHILVDAPKNPGADTAADDKALGLRPFWVSIPAEMCTNAFERTVSNKEIVEQVRYRDDKHVLSGFEISCVESIRVLNLTKTGATYEVWTKPDGKGDYQLDPKSQGEFQAKGKPLDQIPWVTVYGGRREGFMQARSVIQDIAYKNIEHWQSASDQRNILTVTRYPMQYQIGTKDPIKATGPHIILHAQGQKDGPEVKFGYIEPDGNGTDAGWKDLDRIIAEAEMLAIQLRVQNQQTATGADIEQGSTTSNLITFAHGIEQALNEALDITAKYLGLNPGDGGKAVVNKDFTLSADEVARINALLKLVELNRLSNVTAWAEFKELGVLSPDFDAEAETELLAGQDMGPTPTLTVPLNNAPPPADGSFSRSQSTAVNELLADKISRRAILGLRYDAQFSREVIAHLNDLEVELVRQLVAADVTGVKMPSARRARLEKLLAEAKKETAAQYRRINRLTQGELFKLADIEATATGKLITDSAASVGVQLGAGLPTQATFAALLSDPVIMGAPLSDWWAQQSVGAFTEFSRAIRLGVTAGETVDQLAKRVAGPKWANLRGVRDDQIADPIRKARRGARALVRTSVASVQGTARQSVYDANLDVIEFFVHVSRLDSRTSDICLARAGKRWDAETKQPVGHSLPFQVPPLHPNCRSLLAPVPYGGGQLAKNLGADEWIKGLSQQDQEALLGKGKSALYRAGKIKVSDLIDQSNRPLTLEQLAEH